MSERKNYGWSALGILGMIFTPMGAIFLTLGVLLWHFRVGEDPEDPMIFLAVFGGMGAIFLLLGLGLLLADVHRRAQQRRADEGGYYVMAKISGFRSQENVRVNRSTPQVLECHYTDPATGVVHVYHSRYLYTDVSDLLLSDQVPVYLDRMDDRVAFVDVDAVLPKIEVHR